ncbi:MAG: DUF1906 domain-containing protein, partial [Dermatophilaceae bacterium]
MRHHLGRTSLMALVVATSLATSVPAWAGVAKRPAFTVNTTATTTYQRGPLSSTTSPRAVQQVTYGGLQLDVPAGWTVVDLAAHPHACVRFDVHVVYLGTPGAVQDCPAELLGRTEAILLQPMPSQTPYGTMTMIPGAVPALTSGQRLAGEVIAKVSGTDILVTTAFGTDPAVALDVLRSLTVTGAAPRARVPATTNAPFALAATSDPQPLDRSFTWHYGLGFDACTAPALSSMQAWLASPYRSIGIYVGGGSRACTQSNLTASWVRTIATMGWKAQPIYVGRQAPCSAFTSVITPGQEWTQGRDAALDATARAKALGIGQGSDIYYDMESYPQSTDCSGSVRAFLSSWTSTLRFNGYSSGVYSSLATGITDLANGAAQPGFVAPDKIWIAAWDGMTKVYGYAPYVADNQWSPYQRMHQYLGGHDASYGAVTINIDSDYLDSDPNRGSPVGQLESTSTGPSKVTANGWAIDPDTSSPILVQMYVDGRANALTWADQPRPDVAAAYPAAGPNHGYTLTMAATPGPHSVCLYAINTGPGTSRPLGCRTVTAASSDPFGQIDAVTTGPSTVTAAGWAIDPDTSAPTLVQMYVDGRANALTWADQPRPDVAAAYPATGPNHGYTLTMATTPGPHSVCLYAINTGPGTSRPLGCRTVSVANSNPFGQIEAVTTGPHAVTATGWAIDPDTSSPILVQMYVDGRANALTW